MSTMNEQIADIMRRFDFNNVHQHMKTVNWQWHTVGVPSVEQLRETAEELLIEVSATTIGQANYHATGGFYAWRLGERLLLQFVIEWQD